MTEVEVRHELRCPRTELYWRCYFDAGHLRALDAAVGIARRQVQHESEDEHQYVRHTRVWPERQLPGFIERIMGAELYYDERATWLRHEDRLELDIQPSLYPDRAHIRGCITVAMTGADLLVRTWAGEISVEVAVLGTRIERALEEDLRSSLELAAAATQRWIDERR